MQPLALYIHWPYCRAKCPYCDFNSHVAEGIDHDLWLSAYRREIDYIAAKLPDRLISSIYFGGGTPSLMQPRIIEGVLNHVQQTWRSINNLEVSLEANPTSIEQQKFRDFRTAGINRVSVGVQALNDHDLKFLGRQHSAKEAKAALEVAYNTYQRVSFDLIYARPRQTEKAWEAELREALSLARAGHLSLYQLTIEPGTAFETMYKRREFVLPEDDLGGRLYEMTGEIAAAYGLQQYEVSNYARAGEESAHNLAYWHYQDYAGIGPGAHGRLTIQGKKFATRTHRAPQIWLERVQQDGHGYHAFEELEPGQKFEECVMMGLRLAEGIPFTRIEQEGGQSWKSCFDEKGLAQMVEGGYINLSDTHIATTPAGRQRLDSVLGQILR